MTALTRTFRAPSPAFALAEAIPTVVTAIANSYVAFKRDEQEELAAQVLRAHLQLAVDRVLAECQDYTMRHRALTRIALQTDDPAERALIYQAMAAMRRPTAQLNVPSLRQLR